MNFNVDQPVLREVLPFCAALLAVVYIVYHAVGGQNGWLAARALDNDIAPLQEAVAASRVQRDSYSARVDAIRNADANDDVVDAELRYALNMADPRELVLLLPPVAPR